MFHGHEELPYHWHDYTVPQKETPQDEARHVEQDEDEWLGLPKGHNNTNRGSW